MALLTIGAFVASQATAQEATPTPRWKFEVGDQHHWRLTQEIDAVQQLGVGGEVRLHIRVALAATWEVIGLDDAGAATINQSIDRVLLRIDGPGEQTAQYDTADKEPPRGFAARVAPLMESLQDSPLQATMTPRGEVAEVKASEPLLNQLQAAPGAKKLGDLATIKAFRGLLQQNAITFPENAELAPGEAWASSMTIEMPLLGALTAEKAYRYEEEREEDNARLAVFIPQVQLTVAGASSDQTPEVRIKEQKSSGEVVFNRDAGRLQSTKLVQSLSVSYGVGDQSAEQSIKQTVSTLWSDSPVELEEDDLLNNEGAEE